jgi:hypothetical protein
MYFSLVMNTSSKSTALNISKTLATRLEEFARVAGVTPEKFASDIIESAIAPNAGLDPLRSYISGQGNGNGSSLKRALKLAGDYNAFAKAEAARTGKLLAYEAKVESDVDGSFRLYFPVIKSAEVRRAFRANDWLLPSRQRVTA